MSTLVARDREVFNDVFLVSTLDQLVLAVCVLDRRIHVLLQLFKCADYLGLDLRYFDLVMQLLDVLCFPPEVISLLALLLEHQLVLFVTFDGR